MRVLVTGSSGWIGTRLCAYLRQYGDLTFPYDLPNSVLDLTPDNAPACDACIHLAAHKHAPYGEEQPAEVAVVNIIGTQRVVDAFGSNVVLASTCKAADPMTAYGASKLIAERIVLNAGGKVVRLVNVWGSSGSVAEVWGSILPVDEPLPVTDCARLWMSVDQAVKLLADALDWPSGRYARKPGQPVSMASVAKKHWPNRAQYTVPLRRGDRPVERLVAEFESSTSWREGSVRIFHPADQPVELPTPATT